MSATATADEVRAWWAAHEWDKLVPVVRAWADHVVRTRYDLSPDERDDIVSRVTIKVWTAPVVPDYPKTWVRVVVRNLVYDRKKSAYDRTRMPIDTTDEHASAYTADGWIEEAAQRDRLARLRVALTQLPERARRCLVLHDLHGRTCGEIAAQCGGEEGAVRMRLVRARRKLATLYTNTTRAVRPANSRALRHFYHAD